MYLQVLQIAGQLAMIAFLRAKDCPTVGFTGLRLPEHILIFKDTLLRRWLGASPVQAMLGGFHPSQKRFAGKFF